VYSQNLHLIQEGYFFKRGRGIFITINRRDLRDNRGVAEVVTVTVFIKRCEGALHYSLAYSQIQIVPKSVNQRSVIKIKDKSGHLFHFDWSSLNGAQKNKIIADTLGRKILCWSVGCE
jgi:hypothetical protein